MPEPCECPARKALDKIIDHRSERLAYGDDYLECAACHARGKQVWVGESFVPAINHSAECPLSAPCPCEGLREGRDVAEALATVREIEADSKHKELLIVARDAAIRIGELRRLLGDAEADRVQLRAELAEALEALSTFADPASAPLTRDYERAAAVTAKHEKVKI